MNTLRNIHFGRVMLLLNLILFTVGIVHYGMSSSHAKPLAVSSNHMASQRTLLATEPKPCVCTYNVRDGQMERLEEKKIVPEVVVATPPPPPPAAPPNKIGQDVVDGQEFQVPNIVHYIWYNTAPRPLQFHHMLSILSAHKFLSPDIIYFHTDIPPIGEYWEVVKKLPSLKIKKRAPPTSLFNEPVKEPMFYTSHSNVDRIKILMEYGGIYLDFDTFIVRSFDDLRRHVCTIGYESETKACGSVIVCSKRAFFLYMWINAYLDDYRMDEWAYNTGKVPFKLSKRYPHLVHVEKTKLNRPNFQELDQLWGPNTWDWKQNYAVHTWYRLWKDTSPYYYGIEPNYDTIKTWNSTFGEIARTILYGKADLMNVD